MPVAKQTHPTLVWLEPGQTALVRALARRAGLKIMEYGMPPAHMRTWGGGELPVFDGAEQVTDLRQALTTTTAKSVLLATAASAQPGQNERDGPLHDADLLKIARSRGITILSFEPLPGSVGEAVAAESSAWAESCRVLGLFASSRGMQSGTELLEAFGPARTLSVAFRSGAGQGSLGARLFDAMHVAHAIMGVPESIDASVITPVTASGLRLAPGESLRAQHGDLTANMRYAGAKAASLSLSNRAGRWFRGVALVGEGGCLRMDETGLERIDADGQTIERTAAEPEKRRKSSLFDAATDAGAVEALGESAGRSIDPHALRPEPMDLATVLAMCEAALLSARTGQPESPSTVMRMERSG